MMKKVTDREKELLQHIDTMMDIIGSYARLLNVTTKNINLFSAEAQERDHRKNLRGIVGFMNENYGRNMQLTEASDEEE